jgi:hypothetical protein
VHLCGRMQAVLVDLFIAMLSGTDEKIRRACL